MNKTQKDLVKKYNKHVDAIYKHLNELKKVMNHPEFGAARTNDFERNVDSCMFGNYDTFVSELKNV